MNIGTAKKPKYPTVSDLVAVNGHQFLVDERDGKGQGDGSVAAFKRIYIIDLKGTQEVGSLTGEAALIPKAVNKTLFLDVIAALGTAGMAPQDIPAKLEGLAFGPDTFLNGEPVHTLYRTNDNDFIATVTDAYTLQARRARTSSSCSASPTRTCLGSNPRNSRTGTRMATAATDSSWRRPGGALARPLSYT